MATAEKNGAALVANDPDADRLAVAEKGADGAWRVLSGNEIGLCSRIGCGASTSGRRRQVAMLSNAVSSARWRRWQGGGLPLEETLTGFKWLCSRAAELRKDTLCYSPSRRRSDSASATSSTTRMTSRRRRSSPRWRAGSAASSTARWSRTSTRWARRSATTSRAALRHLRDPKTTAAIFERLRTGDGPGGYWSAVGGDVILGVRDLNAGVDTASGGTPKLPTSKSTT